MGVQAGVQYTDFNSRPREGANVVDVNGGRFALISIPAPVKGRTRDGGKFRVLDYFNSRPREGANHNRIGMVRFHEDFNSRPREGANQSNSFQKDWALFQFPPP